MEPMLGIDEEANTSVTSHELPRKILRNTIAKLNRQQGNYFNRIAEL